MGCCGVLHIPSKFPYSSSSSSSSNPSTPPLIHSLFGSSLNRTSSSINSFQLPNIRRRRSLICFSHPKAREVSSDSDKKEENKNAEKEEDIVVTENQESSIGIGRRSSSSENKVIGIGRGLFSVFIPTILKQEENDEKGGDGNLGIVAACLVGLLTGVAVVIFNNAVHEIRDLFWDGIPSRGASWLREEPIQDNWKQVILVPTCGGVMVSLLNTIGASLQEETPSPSPSPPQSLISNLKASLRSVLKAVAASVTLGTGNSLGPEGPSVEIGASIAKGVAHLFDSSNQTKLSLSLIAAGSAAGISSGFNAAVAGCFFAVESVLWPSPVESSPSLTNITSMVILSAVIASVVSEVGLGSEPAFKVPEYDFRSPSELPLYLLLGILCGLVSLTLSRCTAYTLQVADNIHKAIGIPKFLFPVMGGLAVGLIALSYPEILYWGFENVDILLESRPFVKGLPGNLLLQLVGVKILATSLCRASGLVGGYYAPSLFIGAATGMAYGKFLSYAISQSDPIFHFSFLEVASPQAYGLVGMAATLAGVCQVPLTAVLLLFELTQDYRILLPLLGAVGLSSLIAAGQTRKRGVRDKMASLGSKNGDSQDPKRSFLYLSVPSSRTSSLTSEASDFSDLCELESSLCVDDSFTELRKLEERIFVRQAMQTRYVTVKMSTSLTEAVNLMLAEKQSGALIVDDDNFLIGLVTLGDIEECCQLSTKVEKRFVSEICQMHSEQCRILTTATPDMNLLSARSIMDRQGLDQLPIVLEQTEHHIGFPVGLLDKICIDLTCRAVATQEFLSLYSRKQKDKE